MGSEQNLPHRTVVRIQQSCIHKALNTLPRSKEQYILNTINVFDTSTVNMETVPGL